MTTTNRKYIFLLLHLCVIFGFTGTSAADKKTIDEDTKKVDSLNTIAFKQKKSDVAQALNNLFNAENLASVTGYQKGLATTYFYEAGIYHQNGYDKRALSIYYKAKQLFQSIKDTLNMAVVNKEIATSLYADGDRKSVV